MLKEDRDRVGCRKTCGGSLKEQTTWMCVNYRDFRLFRLAKPKQETKTRSSVYKELEEIRRITYLASHRGALKMSQVAPLRAHNLSHTHDGFASIIESNGFGIWIVISSLSL